MGLATKITVVADQYRQRRNLNYFVAWHAGSTEGMNFLKAGHQAINGSKKIGK